MIYVLFVAAQIHFIQHRHNNFCLELQVEVITATTALYPGKPGWAGTRQTFTHSLSILVGIIQYLWLSWASNNRNEISVQCTCMQITVADVCVCMCVCVCVCVWGLITVLLMRTEIATSQCSLTITPSSNFHWVRGYHTPGQCRKATELEIGHGNMRKLYQVFVFEKCTSSPSVFGLEQSGVLLFIIGTWLSMTWP